MMVRLAHIAYLVRDYDEAIAWFTQKLGFELKENAILSAEKLWVIVGPRGSKGSNFLLAKAATPEQQAHIGKAAGGRVAFFLHSQDFARDHKRFQSAGVHFIEQPRQEPYGTVAVFEDLYGNRWDLIGPPTQTLSSGQ